ncbi:probable fucosyltransferase 7 [Phragmites australis]|uniref:probable fucosyltransferase 7 n=1 Tax=Phragmites australis TaxID=29695 RepID=UPI002D794F24|nr:probable fucosyltransferase 7 [Phragmites australis]
MDAKKLGSHSRPSLCHGTVARRLPSKIKPGHSSEVRWTAVVIAVGVMAALLLTVLFGVRWTPSSDAGTWVSASVRAVLNAGSQQGAGPLATVPDPRDRLLGGLLSPDFDDSSCLSRYRVALYRRTSLHALSPHLVSALRRYESLHRLCAPGAPAYARAVERLRAPPNASAPSSGCSYVVWTPTAGLGNRILSITSAFLYALLTDRVLLLHSSGDDLDDLFCEPFPGSTWILPQKDFAIRERFTIDTRESLGNTLSRGEAPGGAPWLYVHLLHNYKAHDRLFFCDDVQSELPRVPWLVFQADNYFAPGLFLIRRHERELARMFPRRDAVFHHLGRYLFHPSNTVWGMVTRYHDSYFAKADERVGIQVRKFKWAPISTDELYGQILSCAHRENILPGVGVRAANATTGGSDGQPEKRKAVVFVSLYSEYSEKLRDLYHEHGAAGGEAVSVFQPTHLGAQHFGDRQQNQKALAEMVLLSFSDVAVTTAVSTFGYVGQGLAGLRPWVLMRPAHGKAPDTPCRLAPTIEPCFHAPPNYDCRAKAKSDTGRMVRHIRHCEDFPQGVQLVE